MERGSQKDQSFKKNILQGATVWCWGCVVFTVVEIIFRAIDGPPLLLSIPLLILIIYSGLGLIAGVALGGISTLMLKITGKRLQQIKVQCFFMASCMATIVLFYGGIVVNEQYLHFSFDLISVLVNIGFILFCLCILVVLYFFFSKIADTSHLLSSFLALSLSVDFFMVGGFYTNETLLPGRFLTFNLRNILANLGVLIGCVVLYFLLYTSFRFLVSRLGTIRSHLTPKKTVMGLSVILIILGILGSIGYINSRSIFKEPVGELKDRPNVILITMDTTRADHLSCYGYERKTSPNLDNFSREGVLFKNAYSASPWTLPSHASIFTGMYPTRHGAHYNADSIQIAHFLSESQKGKKFDLEKLHLNSISQLSQESNTLAEILSERGYRTAGIIGGPYCRSVFGIAQGFDYYNENLFNVGRQVRFFLIYRVADLFLSLNDFFARYGYTDKRIGSEINKAVFGWIEKNHQQPFFLFINYFDSHFPYLPPPSYSEFFGKINEDVIVNRNPEGDLSYVRAEWDIILSVIYRSHQLTPEEKEFLISQYDGEIRYIDHCLGLLFEKLKALKVYDNSLIIITSDHGESFGEHGLVLHLPALYEELLRVPLIIKYPSSSQRCRVVERQVSLVDLLPTVLSSLNYPIPPGIDGEVLKDSDHPIIAESYTSLAYMKFEKRLLRNLKAIYQEKEKYIWASDSLHELYDLEKDPSEEENLIRKFQPKAEIMGKRLKQWLTSFEPPKAGGERMNISKSTKEELRALGYIR